MDYNDFDEEDEEVEEVRRPRKSRSKRKFNRRLNVEYLSVDEDDTSFRANIIRTIASGISQLVTPRQVISFLFILAAYTIIFLFSNVISDLIFVYYECFTDMSEEVTTKLGNFHDAKIRAFGAIFAVLAIMIELDLDVVAKSFKFFKSFIPRSLLLLFVATLSEPNPMIAYEWKQNNGGSYSYNSYVDDDFLRRKLTNIRDELPVFVIRVQAFSSTLLYISVIAYFVLGILCLDQFEPNAFVPNQDNKISPDHLPREMSTSKKRRSSKKIMQEMEGEQKQQQYGLPGDNVGTPHYDGGAYSASYDNSYGYMS